MTLPRKTKPSTAAPGRSKRDGDPVLKGRRHVRATLRDPETGDLLEVERTVEEKARLKSAPRKRRS